MESVELQNSDDNLDDDVMEIEQEQDSAKDQVPPNAPGNVSDSRGINRLSSGIPRRQIHKYMYSKQARLTLPKGKGENLVISIFKGNVLKRVVLTEEVPFVCALCGQCFCHTTLLRQHAENEHSYVEPKDFLERGSGNQVVIERKFHNKATTNGKAAVKTVPTQVKGVMAKERVHAVNKNMQEPAIATNNGYDSDEDDAAPLSDSNSKVGSETAEFYVTHSVTQTKLIKKKKKKKKKRSIMDKPENARYSCPICQATFSKKGLRREHLVQQHGVYVQTGELKFARPLMLDQDVNIQSLEPGAANSNGNVKERPQCPHCSFYFCDRDALEKHIPSHCGTGGVKCDLCKKAILLVEEGRASELRSLTANVGDSRTEDDSVVPSVRDVRENGTESRNHENNVEDEDTCTRDGLDLRRGTHQQGQSENNSTMELYRGHRAGQSKESKPQHEAITKEVIQKLVERIKANKTNGNYKPLTILECVECNEKFFMRAHINNHYKMHKSFTCKVCQAKLPSITALNEHSAKEHKKGLFECPYCSRGYHQLGKLTYHMQGHLGHFQCSFCGKVLMSKQSLVKHLERHVDLGTPVVMANQEEYSAEKPFVVGTSGISWPRGIHKSRGLCGPRPKHIPCSVCDRKFCSAWNLHQHMKGYHPEQYVPPPSDSTTKLACEQCGHLFATKMTLRSHMATHREPTIPCTYPGCDRKLRSKALLASHLKSHYPSKEFMCDLCGKTLKSEGSLQVHQRMHRGELPYPCRYCGKRFRQKIQRSYHECQMHTHDGRFVCNHCGKRFPGSSGLRVHLMTHSSHRPYKCDICGASFPQACYLRAHQRTHTKPFVCPHCGERFPHKGNRRAHLLKVHGIEEPISRFREQPLHSASNNTFESALNSSEQQVSDGPQQTHQTRKAIVVHVPVESKTNSEIGEYEHDVTDQALAAMLSEFQDQAELT